MQLVCTYMRSMGESQTKRSGDRRGLVPAWSPRSFFSNNVCEYSHFKGGGK